MNLHMPEAAHPSSQGAQRRMSAMRACGTGATATEPQRVWLSLVQLVSRRWLALAAEHAAVEECGGALPGRGFRGGSAGAAGPGEAIDHLASSAARWSAFRIAPPASS